MSGLHNSLSMHLYSDLACMVGKLRRDQLCCSPAAQSEQYAPKENQFCKE